ncbi:hypothetical protein ACWGBH_23415, partial [Streptomyces massasporeus]
GPDVAALSGSFGPAALGVLTVALGVLTVALGVLTVAGPARPVPSRPGPAGTRTPWPRPASVVPSAHRKAVAAGERHDEGGSTAVCGGAPLTVLLVSSYLLKP